MIYLIVQVTTVKDIPKVQEELETKFPNLSFVSQYMDTTLLLYRYNKSITLKLINEIEKMPHITSATIDDFDWGQFGI